MEGQSALSIVKRVFILCVFVALSVLLITVISRERITSSSPTPLPVSSKSTTPINHNTNGSDLLLLNTPHCKIPKLDPNHPSLRGRLKAGVVLHCNKYPPYTYDNDTTVYVDLKAIRKSSYKNSFSYCRLIPIVRPVTKTSNHNALSYLPPGPKFNVSIDVGPLNHDHFHAKCYDKNDKMIFQNYHTIIIDKKTVEERCKVNFAKKLKENPDVKENLNIFLIGLDSLSRLNSQRHMKKTRDYLLNVLHATEMVGYNKVGYGTYANMMPVFTGKSEVELGWTFDHPTVYDAYRFIWNDYADNGYRTYFAEDYPSGAMFDYMKPGFRKNPVDYYDRHVFLSMYKQGVVYNEENCILHKLQTDWVIDPAYNFVKKYKTKPHICCVFITRLTHDWLERSRTADEVYYKYFKKAHEEGTFNNSVVIFMGDHGLRFGDIRNTYIGLMEERLPMLFILLPEWFKKKYPSRAKNLVTNSHRLTTPFDVHETMQDVLKFTGKDRTVGGRSPNGKKRAYSLFTEIPLDRTCNDSDISSHWCTCSDIKSVPVNDQSVKDATTFVLNSINNVILKKVSHLCATLTLKTIEQAYRGLTSTRKSSQKLIYYKIIFTVRPSGARFEATVEYDSKTKTYVIDSYVSRINIYWSERRCAVSYYEQSLCYCKVNLSGK